MPLTANFFRRSAAAFNLIRARCPPLHSCYYIDYVAGDFDSRRNACRLLGGDLVQYQTYREQAFVGGCAASLERLGGGCLLGCLIG